MTTKERPILFSGPMVRAILQGRKTQTRRAVKFVQFDRSDTPGYDWHFRGTAKGIKTSSLWQDMRHEQALSLCPYGQPGDRLWVRETWCNYPMAGNDGAAGLCYRATNGSVPPGSWKPSIHMPRVYSRITLEITGVRVERLQDITNADCVAEGIEPIGDEQTIKGTGFTVQAGRLNDRYSTVRQLYSELWESINGPGAWNANPWVWVVEFRRCEQ